MKTGFSKIMSILIFCTTIYLIFFHDAVISKIREVKHEERLVVEFEIDSLKTMEILRSLLDTLSIPVNIESNIYMDSSIYGFGEKFIARLDTISGLQREYIKIASLDKQVQWEKWFVVFLLFGMSFFILHLIKEYFKFKKERRRNREEEEKNYNARVFINLGDLISLLDRYEYKYENEIGINEKAIPDSEFYDEFGKIILRDFDFLRRISVGLSDSLLGIMNSGDGEDDSMKNDNLKKNFKGRLSELKKSLVKEQVDYIKNKLTMNKQNAAR